MPAWIGDGPNRMHFLQTTCRRLVLISILRQLLTTKNAFAA